MNKFKVEDRVSIVGKNAYGKIAYIGKTHFSEGEWFGIILDEAKGRNNGSIDGKCYFRCPRNHGIFVRLCQLEPQHLENISEKSGQKFKIRYPDYLGKYIKTNSCRSKNKTNASSEIKTESSTPVQFSPVNSAIENLLKKQSNEVSNMKDKKREAEENLKKVKSELQTIVEELNKQSGVEIDLRNNLLDAQRNVAILKEKLCNTEKKLCNAEKKLELSEQKRRKLAATIQEFRDITEIAVIEKEISEEITEQFEVLFKDETDRCKNLEIEIEIMKEEMQLQYVDGVPAIHFVKELKHQNMVFSNALQQLRDIYQKLKRQLSAYEKTVEKNSNEIKDLKEIQKSMKQVICGYKDDVAELYDSIDSMMDADDVVFDVTDQNLKHQETIEYFCQVLNDTEEQLEVCEEVEETLEEIKSIDEEEKECLELKVKCAQLAVDQQILLLKNKDEIIYKYRELTSVLREKNYEQSNELERITKERKEAVALAENIKLEIHRDRRKSLKDLIQEESLKIDLESFKQELNYWSTFMPNSFFEKDGESCSIQVKLVASKMVKKLGLLIKLLQMSHEKYDVSKFEELMSLTTESKFLMFAFQLYGLLRIFMKSFDLTHTEYFLTLSKYLDLLTRKYEEIERYLKLLCEKEIDTQNNLDSIQKTYNALSQILENKHIPIVEETLINLEGFLNIILICCKCIISYCIALETFEGFTLECKNQIKQLTKVAKNLKIHARSVHNCIVNSEKENLYFNLVVEDKVKSNLKLISNVMEYLITLHESFYENRDFNTSNIKCISLNGIIMNLTQTEVDLDHLRKAINHGEFLVESVVEYQNSSSIYKWAEYKKHEGEETISAFKYKIACCEKEISYLSRELEAKKKQDKKLNDKIFRNASQQTEELEVKHDSSCFHGNSLGMDYLKLQLHDLKCSMKYLHDKNLKLRMASIKQHQSILSPLKVLPKPIYHPETHNIYILQKRLNKISVNLRGIIIPLVVDITGKSNCKGRKYKKYLFERILISKSIEEELWSINLEVKRLRNSRSIWSDRNPFSPRNDLYSQSMQ